MPHDCGLLQCSGEGRSVEHVAEGLRPSDCSWAARGNVGLTHAVCLGGPKLCRDLQIRDL